MVVAVDGFQGWFAQRKLAPDVTDWKSRLEGAILTSLRAGVTQLVECLPSKQNVEGSSPFSRSQKTP